MYIYVHMHFSAYVCVFVRVYLTVCVAYAVSWAISACFIWLSGVLAASAAEPEPTAHCLSGRGLIPLLKAHSSKHHFSKATHAHPACPVQPRFPILMCSLGFLHEGGELLRAPDLISNNYQCHVSLSVEGKELFAHARTQQLFVPRILQRGRATLVHFSASISATSITLHLHDKGRRYCNGKCSNWSLNLWNLNPSNS